VGDLSGKFGYLQGSFESRAFTDQNLDVSSIIQRSLVIHDNGGERWVCGTIVDSSFINPGACNAAPQPVIQMPQPVIQIPQQIPQQISRYPLSATARLTSPFNDISQGQVTFKQAFQGGPTTVELFVVGTVGTVNGGKSFGEYHIHDFAVNPNDPNGPCSVTSVGGHYNPTNIADYKLCNPNVPSTCEVGDLSGKFGYLQGSFESRTFIDRGLDVASIIQRSLVIHDNGGERWVCGTIVDDASSNFGRRRKCLFYDHQLQSLRVCGVGACVP
jgi:Cu/Zn superoxide dismutase